MELSALARPACVLSERAPLLAALTELSAGRPVLVAGEELTLLSPADAIGHQETRALVDLPRSPAKLLAEALDPAEALAALGQDCYGVIELADSGYGLVERTALVELMLHEGHAGSGWSAETAELLDHLPEGVVLVCAEQRVLRANEPGRRLLAVLGALPGEPLRSLAGVPLAALLEDAATGVPRDLRVDEPTHRIVSVRTLRAQQGDAASFMIVLRDVTHVRARQAREAKEERHALLGQLAGGIAHDFNNVLTVIMTQASMLGLGQLSPAVVAASREIVEATSRAAGLVRQLITFGRRDPAATSLVDVGELVRDLEGLFARVLGEQIELRTEIQPGLSPVAADPAQLERIIANLVVNARNAMPEGGALTLRADLLERTLESPGRGGSARLADVRLVVSDTGVGMDAPTLARIFEPYYSQSGGTGLGLWNVRETVASLGGAVAVESVLGQGSTFTVTLPAASAELARAAPRPSSQPPARQLLEGSGRVLVVEDSRTVGRTVQEALEMAGYAADVRLSPEGAHELVDKGPPDLLIVDSVLATGSGLALARDLHGRFPRMPVIVITDPMALEGPFELAPGRPAQVLQKPFSAVQLLERVHGLIGEAA